MKAIVYESYGPPEVLKLKEIPKPIPKDGQILVKIHATTVSTGDVKMRIPDPFLARLVNGLFRPGKIPILGLELAGEVESLGPGARRFNVGDPVFAFSGFGFGAYAGYICLPEGGTNAQEGWVALKPANRRYEEAAPIPGGGVTALEVLKKAKIRRGDRVLVYGASGSVGTYAVQLAAHLGAEVTGVSSTANLDLVRSLGAGEVIDFTRQDFTIAGPIFEVVFDAVAKNPPSQAKKALKENGTYLNVQSSSGSGREDLRPELHFLKELAETGALRTVIDRRYQLAQAAEAHSYVEKGHKQGNVILTVLPNGKVQAIRSSIPVSENRSST
jgi:NADPH:quinone reductase-like Zn-dependent oxidoreductase